MVRPPGVYVQLFYHFVWSTKYRQPSLTDQIEKPVVMIFRSKAKEMNLEIIEAEGAWDHIHVLLRTNQNVAPAEIPKHFKGASSHFVNHVTLNDNYEKFYWQDGYGVVSVSPEAVKSVAEYVRNQKAHHRRGTLISDLEESVIL